LIIPKNLAKRRRRASGCQSNQTQDVPEIQSNASVTSNSPQIEPVQQGSKFLEYSQRNAESVLGVILGFGSMLLFIGAEYMTKRYGSHFPAQPIILCASATTCILVPALLWMAGSRRRAHKRRPNFGFIQILGITLYFLTALFTMICFYYVSLKMEFFDYLMSTTGTGNFIAQLILLIALNQMNSKKVTEVKKPESSLSYMITTSDVKELKNTILSVIGRLSDFEHNYYVISEWVLDVLSAAATWTLYALPVISLTSMIFLEYLMPGGPIHLLMFTFTRAWLNPTLAFLTSLIYLGRSIYFFFFSWNLNAAVWAGFTFFYSTTYNDSHHTGRRASPLLRNFTPLWDLFTRYFDFKIISDAKLSTTKTYMFGYHPHGIYPYTCLWGPLTSVWKQKFPGVEFDGLGATVVLLIPTVRDVAMWVGGRDVTRKSINDALKNNRSVALVPGGQAEMRESRSILDEVVLLRRHKGFIRMAIENGADLVPMYCFGETQIFDNVYYPKMQSWFVKRIGFGFPHFPYGKYYLPVPRDSPLRLVVGEPIPVTKLAQPTEEQIDEIHQKYFDSLKALVEKHKDECGYPKTTIKFKDD